MPSPEYQNKPSPPASPAVDDVTGVSLASEFESLSAGYQNVIRFAQHQHGIRIVPLQELKGGFTGAALFLVSVSSSSSGKLEHLVLKLDRPEAGEPDELVRHKRALDQAPPDFARHHMAEVAFGRVELDGCIAILTGLRGRPCMAIRLLPPFNSKVRCKLFSAC